MTVVTAPAATGELTTFAPAFSTYKAIVMNYDAPDERWPLSLKASFENLREERRGAARIVHAADNAFAGWTAFNEMIGVGGWRNRTEQADRSARPRRQGGLRHRAGSSRQPRSSRALPVDSPRPAIRS